MPSDQQMTVSRADRTMPPANISKVTRQVVPAFLQKLYEMINDPKNSDLIRWSDAGDSFFVLDHERFAHDVLGRWFKHRNFSSFVRQLNMYGFHKIPHLQQGVLKSDSETEFWNFAHDNFRRGQPDLLCLIQRKKTSGHPGIDDGAMEVRDPIPAMVSGSGGPSTIPPTLPSGQVLDIQSILNGIGTIKRHQTTISAEVNELKRSNQLLWQDAMAARTRHQKQQDTTNRIVKFLAGIFGQSTTHPKDETVESGSPHVMKPRRMARLMIEDAKRERKGIVELDDTVLQSTVETPASEPAHTPSASQADSISIAEDSNPPSNPILVYAPPPPVTPRPSSSTVPPEGLVGAISDSSSTNVETLQPLPHQEPETQQQEQDVQRAITPSRPSGSPIFDMDHRVQGVINQLSPMQLQQLINSLASQPIPDLSSENSPNAATTSSSAANSHLTHYQPPYEFSLSPSVSGSGGNLPLYSLPLHQPSSEGLISFSPYDTFPQAEQVGKQWQATDDLEKDVNGLNNSIHHLIQTFGLDPSLLEPRDVGSTPASGDIPMTPSTSEQKPVGDPPTSLLSSRSGVGPEPQSMDLSGDTLPTSDFDFDTFFNDLPASTSGDLLDYGDATSTAFLDDVPSPVDSAPPPILNRPANLRGGMRPPPSTPPPSAPNPTASFVASTGGSASRKRKPDALDADDGPLAQLRTVDPAAILALVGGGPHSEEPIKPKRRKEM